MADFDYNEAFSRNIGWVTRQEQELLRTKRVAIAGLGGVGGCHLLTLTRLGIGAFSLSDFDHFELANFNRQAGAMVSSLGRSKLSTLTATALDINPELNIRQFPDGVKESNIGEFLSGADLYLDSLDYFAVEARRAVFAACYEMGIPAVTAAPLGMGVALLEQACRQAEGHLRITSAPGEGTEVVATFRVDHIDRKPLADVGSTLVALIAGNPEVDFRFESDIDSTRTIVDTREIKAELEGVAITDPRVLALIRRLFDGAG